MIWNQKFNFDEIGTSWTIEYTGVSKLSPELLIEKIRAEINKFSRVFSRFDKNSAVFKSSQTASEIIVPKAYLPLLDIYKSLYKLTDGLFTPLIGNLLSESGYDENYSLVQKKLNPVPQWDQVIEISRESINFKKPWLLDFGAAGKGFIIDLIGELLVDQNIKSYCIDAGGDIRYKSDNNQKLKIGLEHPDNLDQVLGIANLETGSICGSSGNRRKWANLHHIFNPKKLDSVREVLAVWVVSDTALIADALSTALFLVNPEKLSADFQFQFLIIYPDFTFKKSPDFPGEVYVA